MFSDSVNVLVFVQFSGHLEEVLDLGLIGKDASHLVVISNSSKIKVFNRLTMECQILAGHSDTVMAVSTCPKKNLFVTASKVCGFETKLYCCYVVSFLALNVVVLFQQHSCSPLLFMHVCMPVCVFLSNFDDAYSMC